MSGARGRQGGGGRRQRPGTGQESLGSGSGWGHPCLGVPERRPLEAGGRGATGGVSGGRVALPGAADRFPLTWQLWLGGLSEPAEETPVDGHRSCVGPRGSGPTPVLGEAQRGQRCARGHTARDVC